MTVIRRYLLLQIPGLLAVAAVMTLLHFLFGVSFGIGALAVVLWFVKDLVIYPFVRPAYERGDHLAPHARLLGAKGVTQQALDPCGYVRVRGESWRATANAGERPIPSGQPVVVQSVDGLRLVVGRIQADSGDRSICNF